MEKTSLLMVFLCCMVYGGMAQAQPELQTSAAIEKLNKDIPSLLQKADVPGISIALIRGGKVVWSNVYGAANAATGKNVTSRTVFEAASLSKPVFAYGVLKLVDQGKLNLDSPLNKYLGNNYDVVDDPRINLVTARRVLTHSSGFPNWRDDDQTKNLLIHFTPGERWSYSGEGMVYLSKVVEKITGLSIEDFMQQMVLQPLGMSSSSYIWQPRYDSLKAWRHDVLGDTTGRWKPLEGNVAASLTTNAADYAKFLVAIMNGTGLKKSTWKQMLQPQIRVTDKYPSIAWGLGIGLETMPEGEYAWHWGDNGDGKAYFTVLLPAKDGVVYFADGANGLSIVNEIMADGIGGNHPALANLGYDRYNSPARKLLKDAIAEGAPKALEQYKIAREHDSTASIPENAINSIGYTLMHIKKMNDAAAVFQQNTIDFPQSSNAWDSFGEVNMNMGNKAMAITCYQKTLALNPNSQNAKAQLRKLTE